MDENSLLTKFGTDGTHSFFPPEYCGAHQPIDGVLRFNGEKVDVWCAGVSLHAFLFGYIPFYRECMADLFEAIEKGEFPRIPEFDDVSKECIEFLYILLRRDATARPTAQEALEHPWIQNAPPTGSQDPILIESKAEPVVPSQNNQVDNLEEILRQVASGQVLDNCTNGILDSPEDSDA